MLILVFLLTAAASRPNQTMAGSAFERFAYYTDRSCPSRELRSITPGDLSWEQETFEDQLLLDEKKRLASFNKQDQRCAKSEGGLACPTSATLDALWRAKMLPSFARFSCTHLAPVAHLQDHVRRPQTSSSGGIGQDKKYTPLVNAATAILQNLDLNTFPNSTGPRRQRPFHTPTDYGLTKLERFDDGWAQISKPDGSSYMSALVLDGRGATPTICFNDTGGRSATYEATQVLRLTRGSDGRWAAVQILDRPDCRNRLSSLSATAAQNADATARTRAEQSEHPPRCVAVTLDYMIRDDDAVAPFVLAASDHRRFRLFGQDLIDPASWQATDALRTCDQPGPPATVQITDLRRNESLSARAIRVPLDAGSALRLVREAAGARRPNGGARIRPDVVRLEAADDRGFSISVHAADPCLPGQPTCSSLIGHYSVNKASGIVVDADRDPG